MTVSNLKYPASETSLSKEAISWEVFEKDYLTREDEWKYEWVDGIIEKTKRVMYPYQYHILYNLRQLFRGLFNKGKVSGSFEAETDVFLTNKIHRRPDISYFTKEQVAQMGHGQTAIPEFVVEVVSKTDLHVKQNLKMKNYREAGVKVVWQIFSETEEVEATRGRASIIKSGNEICSASPVLPDFKISVKDIFKKIPLADADD